MRWREPSPGSCGWPSAFCWGTLIGAFILTVINNGLNLMNVSPYSQFIARGAILAFAVAINSMKSFRK